MSQLKCVSLLNECSFPYLAEVLHANISDEAKLVFASLLANEAFRSGWGIQNPWTRSVAEQLFELTVANLIVTHGDSTGNLHVFRRECGRKWQDENLDKLF